MGWGGVLVLKERLLVVFNSAVGRTNGYTIQYTALNNFYQYTNDMADSKLSFKISKVQDRSTFSGLRPGW